MTKIREKFKIICTVTLLRKKKKGGGRGGRESTGQGKKQRSFVADGGETVENKDRRDGDPRSAAEDKSVERGHATDRGIAPIALGARSSRGCKRSGGRISEQFLKKGGKEGGKKKKLGEEKERRGHAGSTCASNYFYYNHHHYRVLTIFSSLF